jgi:hypothetical protein
MNINGVNVQIELKLIDIINRKIWMEIVLVKMMIKYRVWFEYGDFRELYLI